MVRIPIAPPYVLAQARKLVDTGRREPRSLHLSWFSNWGLSLRWWDERKYAFLVYGSDRTISTQVQKWVREAFSQAYGKPFVGQGVFLGTPREQPMERLLEDLSGRRREIPSRERHTGETLQFLNESVRWLDGGAIAGPEGRLVLPGSAHPPTDRVTEEQAKARERTAPSTQGVYFLGGAPKEVKLPSVTFTRLNERYSME